MEPGSGHHPGGEQQRIAGQKGRDHKACLAKDNNEQNGVDPQPVLLNQLKEVDVDVQHKVPKIADHLHEAASPCLLRFCSSGKGRPDATLVPQAGLWHNNCHAQILRILFVFARFAAAARNSDARSRRRLLSRRFSDIGRMGGREQAASGHQRMVPFRAPGSFVELRALGNFGGAGRQSR